MWVRGVRIGCVVLGSALMIVYWLCFGPAGQDTSGMYEQGVETRGQARSPDTHSICQSIFKRLTELLRAHSSAVDAPPGCPSSRFQRQVMNTYCGQG